MFTAWGGVERTSTYPLMRTFRNTHCGGSIALVRRAFSLFVLCTLVMVSLSVLYRPSRSARRRVGAIESFAISATPLSAHNRASRRSSACVCSTRTGPRQQAKADRARAHPRDSRGSTSASTRVESKRQCFGRDFLAPGSIGDLSEHTGKPCLGAQVDTPTHRCDSHVRRRPALVSAPPHVPVRPFVWVCGS